MRLLLLSLLGALLACTAPASAQQAPLPEFSTINLCVPFTVAISPGPTYALQVEADAVANAIQGSVRGGALSLETTGSGFMSSSSPIQVTVLLPADKLAQVNQFGQADTFIIDGEYHGIHASPPAWLCIN
jgi:hypothetical protein